MTVSEHKPREWLAERRGSLTHQQVADLAGVSRSFYTEIETGVKDPGVKTAKKIGGALGFNWTLFFEENGRETPQNGRQPSVSGDLATLEPTGTDGR